MNFKLYFKAEINYEWRTPFYFNPYKGGLKLLDEARSAIGVGQLNPKLFNNHVPEFQQNVSLIVSEDDARQSGLFEETNDVEVICKMGFLNQFASLKFKTERKEDTDEIVMVSPYYEIDQDRVLTAWFEAECPTKWGFDE